MAKKPKICVVGAGFSGICAGIKLKTELGYDDFTIYDKNEDFGGTWLTQTYPGCACDVPSHLYSFSFEPNPDWSTTYARQPEILEYIIRIATKYNLYSKAKFCHKVETAKWNEITKKWLITVCNLETQMSEEIAYDFLIIGTGPFGNANIPDQFLSFKGPVIHSSKWDPNVELDGKVVAIIGSGASAVQIIPQIVSKVKKLISFQRRPAWVTTLRLHEVPSSVKTAFRVLPGLLWLFRILLFLFADMQFLAFKAKSFLADFAAWRVKQDMKQQIPNPELRDKLVPDYRFGCKRITPSNSYFKSLSNPNCEVVRKQILSADDSTITTEDGREYPVDVLILATGYRVQEFSSGISPWSPLDIRGRSISDLNVTPTIRGVHHYLGIVNSEIPNAFALLGPNTAYGHNTVIFPMECQMNWIVKVLKEMGEKKFKLICVKKEVEEEYRKEIDMKMKDLVWGAYKCDSYYINSKGTNTTIHPGSATSYWKLTRNVDFSKFELE